MPADPPAWSWGGHGQAPAFGQVADHPVTEGAGAKATVGFSALPWVLPLSPFGNLPQGSALEPDPFYVLWDEEKCSILTGEKGTRDSFFSAGDVCVIKSIPFQSRVL